MDRAELSKLLGYVSSSVGHQVINSLSTIVSQTEILRTLAGRAAVGSAEVSDRIDTILRVTLEASAMTRRLLVLSHDLTSLEAADLDSAVLDLDLGLVAADFLNRARLQIGPEAEWVLDASPTPRIQGDPGAIDTALRLLAANSVESLPEGKGTVTITVRAGPRDWATLEVQDTGCGMAAETLDHAAEPFFTTKQGHRGLGLTIARGIWRRHRGSLFLESQPGVGTTVRLSAPPSELE
jgi:signal transduction histidine kinase